MPAERTCGQCGAPLPENAPGGRCPHCLVQLALEESAGGQGDVHEKTALEPGVDLPRKTIVLSESDTIAERTGMMIGRYKLLQQIGEGGFGIVFMAEQTEPVQRKVALKIVKAGMDTREVVARFEAERQALALMDHPNIARVLDGGATASGRPYFVMELVRGIPITNYCDQASLSTRERLELFTKVCRAVQHAHQKGVIHRDLKPSNVLVTLHDGEPVPKVIDFGVAKALGQRLTDKTLFTRFEQMIGTPAYMSPEQAALSGLDVDTRSDIYSLGVLLYELLTGVTPLDAETLRRAALDEVRRMIQETEPAKPSTRITDLVAADVRRLTTVATEQDRDSLRRLLQQKKELISVIRGDLDWITMKAIEKDRRRRYETVNGLAADIARHLQDQPVLACPPSALYRVQKVARRHRVAFAAGAVVTLALVLGVVVSTWQAVRATRAEQQQSLLRAEAQRAQATEAGLRKEAVATGAQLLEALDQLERQRAEELFAAGDNSSTLAYLARALRQNPRNQVAAMRLLSALPQHGFAIGSVEPLRHESWVYSAHFSPDGLRVVTASPQDNAARIWDAKTGQPLTEPLKHESSVYYAQFSPDGQRVVTVSQGEWDQRAHIRIWGANTGKQLSELVKPVTLISSVQLSPDGQRVVTVSGDKRDRVTVSDLNTGKPISEILLQLLVNGISVQVSVNSVQFSPDGLRLLTASSEGGAQIWDAKTGEPLTEPLKHEEPLRSAQFSPDGQRVVTVGDLAGPGLVEEAHVTLWDANTGKPLTEPIKHEEGIGFFQFAPDGQRVVIVSRDRTVRVWDANMRQPLTEPFLHAAGIRSAQFSPDGQRVVTTSEDGPARVWDVKTGQPLTEPFKHGAAIIHSAEFSPDGQRVVTASRDDPARIWDLKIGQPLTEPLREESWGGWGASAQSTQFSPDGSKVLTVSIKTARVWDVKTCQPLAELFTHGDYLFCAEFSPDGRRVVTASNDKTARVWDVKTGQALTEPLEHADGVTSAQFSQDGQRVITLSGKTVRVWDAKTGQLLGEPFKFEAGINSVKVSPEGLRVVTVSSNSVRVWDVNTGQPLTEALRHETNVFSLEFSSDGTRLVTSSVDFAARVWDIKTGKPMTNSLKHESRFVAQFSPDGSQILTDPDNTAWVWDVKTGKPLIEPLKHAATVCSARFSPDGLRVVTASADRTARVWDVKTGQPLTEPLKHGDTVWAARFSPDGTRLVTSSRDGIVRIWDLGSAPVPVPGWVAEFAEAFAGQRLNDQGVLEPIPFAQIHAVLRSVSSSTTTDVWTRWAQWLLGDPFTRTISPFSDITVPEYVKRRIAENSLESLQEAVRLVPTNGLALARLARAVLAQAPADNPRQDGEAMWYSERAVRFAPAEAEARWARAAAFERTGKLLEALKEINVALEIEPRNAELWHLQGRILEKVERNDEAYHALTRAIELAVAKPGETNQPQAGFYLTRSGFLKRQNRLQEAGVDNCLARGIPPRDAQADGNLVDLSLYYNTGGTDGWHPGPGDSDLSELLCGVQTLAGVPFDVRGLIQVGDFRIWEKSPEVVGISVQRVCRRLHFLHAAREADDTPDYWQIGRFVMHYSNGRQEEFRSEEKTPFTVAWSGKNAWGRPLGRTIRLFKTTWENPDPAVIIRSIHFVWTAPGPPHFLVAITAEP